RDFNHFLTTHVHGCAQIPRESVMQATIRAFEIETLLDRAPAGIEILSLDCFDTLIWRNTHAPTDVFAELARPGGGIEPRMWAETNARKSAFSKRGLKE